MHAYFLKIKFLLLSLILCTLGGLFFPLELPRWDVYVLNQNCVLSDVTLYTSRRIRGPSEINLVYFAESRCVLPIFSTVKCAPPGLIVYTSKILSVNSLIDLLIGLSELFRRLCTAFNQNRVLPYVNLCNSFRDIFFWAFGKYNFISRSYFLIFYVLPTTNECNAEY